MPLCMAGIFCGTRRSAIIQSLFQSTAVYVFFSSCRPSHIYTRFVCHLNWFAWLVSKAFNSNNFRWNVFHPTTTSYQRLFLSLSAFTEMSMQWHVFLCIASPLPMKTLGDFFSRALCLCVRGMWDRWRKKACELHMQSSQSKQDGQENAMHAVDSTEMCQFELLRERRNIPHCNGQEHTTTPYEKQHHPLNCCNYQAWAFLNRLWFRVPE